MMVLVGNCRSKLRLNNKLKVIVLASLEPDYSSLNSTKTGLDTCGKLDAVL